MELIYKRCCGLDIHKENVVACCVNDHGRKEVRTFSTMTDSLLELCKWLKQNQIEMAAMESTASYWKPLFNLFEMEGISAILVNAQHIKNVPGRKTDVKDSEWIADLLRHGLLKASYVPARDQRELRELIRYRTSIVSERGNEYNRMDKVLQGANIKITSVSSGVDSKSVFEMLTAIINGEQNERVMAAMARGRMRSKQAELQRALRGYIQPHQQMILKAMMEHIAYLDKAIAELDAEIARRLADRNDIVERLDEIPGVGSHTAQVILSEVGSDMSHFPSAKNLVSWAGLCPANNESAGKKKRGKKRKGNQTLRTSLVQAARAAARTKNTYLSSMYSRIASRRGSNRAALAVARTILEASYYMIRDGVGYHDLGANYYDQRNLEHIKRHSVKRLESLGYKVILEEAA